MTELAFGISFDTRRYQPDIELFAKKRQKIDSTDVHGAASLPPIDFFTDHSPESVTDGSCVIADENEAFTFNDDGSDFENQTEVANFRKKHRIKVVGEKSPDPLKGFNHLRAKYSLNRAAELYLKLSGFSCLTSIQKQAIPVIMEERDLIACAPTGTGKTLAFAIPVIQKILEMKPAVSDIRALIITPTRELSRQIHREMLNLAPKRVKIVLLSKSNQGQTDKKIDILISTPLRLISALKSGNIVLKSVQHLVIDEADKLFEMGFLEQMDEIVAECNGLSVQKSIFSATINMQVENLAKSIMSKPLSIFVGQKNAATENVEQKLVYVGTEEGKLIALRQLVQDGFKPPALIFVDGIDKAKELFRELVYDGINVDVIHSDRSQAQRDNIINNFRAGKIWVLIATDLMGRGVDFKGVELVINFDFPRSATTYVHRIGRSGRADRKGQSITYFTKEDTPNLAAIAKVIKASGGQIPDWMIKDEAFHNQATAKMEQRGSVL